MLDEKAENAKKSDMLMVLTHLWFIDEKGLLQLSYNRYSFCFKHSSGTGLVQTADLSSAKDWLRPMRR